MVRRSFIFQTVGNITPQQKNTLKTETANCNGRSSAARRLTTVLSSGKKDSVATPARHPLKNDGTREYYNDNTVHGKGTGEVTEDITAEVPTGTKHMFLVVSPALSTYIQHKWDENIKNDDQWPYQFELVGTTATSIIPYVKEPDFNW